MNTETIDKSYIITKIKTMFRIAKLKEKLAILEGNLAAQKQQIDFLDVELWKMKNPPVFKRGDKIKHFTITDVFFNDYRTAFLPKRCYLYTYYDNVKNEVSQSQADFLLQHVEPETKKKK